MRELEGDASHGPGTTLLRRRRHGVLATMSAVVALGFSPQAFARTGVTTTAGTYVGFSRGCDVLHTAGSGSAQIANGSNNAPCPTSSYTEDVSSDGLSGARVTYSGTVDSTGTATSAFGYTHESLFRSNGPSNGAFADANTAANLGDGTLHVHAQGGTVYVGQGSENAVATARFDDGLHSNVAGAAADALTAIGVHFSLDGRVVAGEFASSLEDMTTSLEFGNSGIGVVATARGINPFLVSSHSERGWTSFSYSALDPTHVAFDGIYNLLGSIQTLGIGAYLSAGAAFADLDYGNTLRVSFTLPGNVSFSSDSGVFLTSVNAVTPVPEPETWALMMAGLGLLGHFARRRRTA